VPSPPSGRRLFVPYMSVCLQVGFSVSHLARFKVDLLGRVR
jgi:hypothetical protein